MSDCGCDEAQRNLEEYLRKEMCTTSEQDIREHIENCPECQDEAFLAVTLTDVVARACKETAPADLRQQVLSQLRSVQATH